MQTYDSEEVKAYVAHCKEKGIQDSSRLFWLQTAMRAGIDKDLLESLEDPKLTNYDAFRILGCNTMGIPNEILTEITKKPETITERIEKYYEEKYTPDKKKIYQEIFDSFQVQWQQNFNQLLKQTELLSDTQEFLKSQILEREKRVADLQRTADELRESVRQERRRAENLEQEKEEWKKYQEKPKTNDQVEIAVKTGDSPEQHIEKQQIQGRFVKFLQRNLHKNPEERLLALLKPLEDDQIEEVIDGLEKGLEYREVKRYADPDYSANKMKEMKIILLKQRKGKKI